MSGLIFGCCNWGAADTCISEVVFTCFIGELNCTDPVLLFISKYEGLITSSKVLVVAALIFKQAK